MSVAAQTLSPPSRTLMFLEGRAISELGAFLGALPLLSLAPRGDGHPVLVLPGLVAVLRTVIAEQKSGVSGFISDQVKSWDMGQLISLIEINIGRDLQYIRFNGSLIGGLAGLALYTLEYLLRLL